MRPGAGVVGGVEGGVAGSIDIITRKPLDFPEPVTFQASAGVVHAELPSKTDGQYSALANWKNSANTFGVMVQGFWETRHLRRDGVEVLGYNTIAAGTPFGDAHPDLVGVQFPDITGAALFTQKRERKGGRQGAQEGQDWPMGNKATHDDLLIN